jgi:hypothetical protein
MQEIFELVSMYGFPIVVSVILLVFFIRMYSSFNENLRLQTELLAKIQEEIEVIMYGKEE